MIAILSNIFNRVISMAKAVDSPVAYYCNALQGDSGYNICINSDMTLSCNCQDYDGKGHLGDLTQNSFEDIFFGHVANKFRAELSDGKFPIPLCQYCMELRQVTKAQVNKLLKKVVLPHRGIMAENTVLCNYNCLNCNRLDLMGIRKKNTMTIEDTHEVAAIISRNNIKSLCYFNLGEPFIDNEIYEKIKIIRDINPELNIVVSTNGSLVKSDEAVNASLLLNHIFFSIDGPDQSSMATYQAKGSFQVSYDNMKNLVQIRNRLNQTIPVIEWKYVVFRWNDSNDFIEKAVALAREAGVDIISFWRGSGTTGQISERYESDPFFQNLGIASWKGREIDFRVEQNVNL